MQTAAGENVIRFFIRLTCGKGYHCFTILGRPSSRVFLLTTSVGSVHLLSLARFFLFFISLALYFGTSSRSVDVRQTAKAYIPLFNGRLASPAGKSNPINLTRHYTGENVDVTGKDVSIFFPPTFVNKIYNYKS